MNFLQHLFSATHSEHCGYLHSHELLKLLPREGAIFASENAGGFKIGDHAILFKMESHNHPCAVEPFNGAATGIGGIVRDVLAMNARPIALCNSLKFGDDTRIIEGVVEGISNYGNSIGVPNISTEVLYHPCFTQNPLVNVTCIGIAKYDEILTSDKALAGQKLILAGSHTMKDGLHGASFASKELENNKEDKLSIQIANPFMKKKLIEACLEIFSKKLVASCQDCGAAGILSSTSEVAYKSGLRSEAGRAASPTCNAVTSEQPSSGVGVEIDLDKIHIGDKSIKDFEIMLSETQERMLFVADESQIAPIGKILERHAIPYSVIGEVIEEKNYIVRNKYEELANIPVKTLVTPPEVNINFSKDGQSIKEKPERFDSPYLHQRYDHTVGARTQFSPDDDPQFNALWIWEENCSLGVYTFSTTVETTYDGLLAAANFLREKGYEPKGITNCLNFTNPEIPPTMHEFRETILQIKRACEELKIPVCSGNVSFYNGASEQRMECLPTQSAVCRTCEADTDIRFTRAQQDRIESKIINTPTFTMLGVKSI